MKKLLLLTVFTLSLLQLNASHYMGGEITWDCLGNGRFKFTMKLYCECGGDSINFDSTQTIKVYNHPTLSIITMKMIAQNDISPFCYSPSLQITCANYADSTVVNQGAVQELIFTSDFAYPNGVLVLGVPPAEGFIFALDGSGRNPSTNILNLASMNWTLRSVMYPFNGYNTLVWL